MDGLPSEEGGWRHEWEEAQKQMSARVAEWRGGKAASAVLAALETFARGARIGDCPPLASLFASDSPFAEEFVGALVEKAAAGLALCPIGQLPLRHAHHPAAHTLLLARSGGTSLALSAYDGAALDAQPAPRTAEFAPMETWLRVLAGTGTAERVTRRGPSQPLDRKPLEIGPGTVIQRDGRHEALQMRSARGALVVLRLQRCLPDADLVQEFGLEDGRLLHQAAARAQDSRVELAIAVLVAQGRRDAVPGLARIVTGSAPASLRWSALRAVLGLDTRAGLVLLSELAGTEGEVLGPAARGLQRDLIEEWPELERVAQWRG